MNKNIIMTILLIIVLCLGGYLIFDKVIDKKDNNDGNSNVEENLNKEKKEDGDYDLVKAQELMDNYVNKFTIREIFNDGLTSTLKLRIAYKNLNYSTYPEKISYSDINKVYKELFGGEEASKQNFSPTGWCNTYTFDLEQNSYIYSEGQGCGGARWTINYSIKSAIIKNSKLDVEVYYYLFDYNNNLHKNEPNDYTDDTYKIANLNNDERTNDNKLTEEALEKYKNQMDTFTFRFEKYNGNYILKDVFKN